MTVACSRCAPLSVGPVYCRYASVANALITHTTPTVRHDSHRLSVHISSTPAQWQWSTPAVSVISYTDTSAVSGHFGISLISVMLKYAGVYCEADNTSCARGVPKCLGSELSWVRTVCTLLNWALTKKNKQLHVAWQWLYPASLQVLFQRPEPSYLI